MQFKTFVNAVALALLAAGVHAKVPGGTYSIVNKVLSSDDLQRATTFNGYHQMVTVSSYDPIASKQWIVGDADDLGMQMISPVDDDRLECVWENDHVTVILLNNVVLLWTITQNEGDPTTYTIQHSGEGEYWGLDPTQSHPVVTLDKNKTESGEQSWYFYPAVAGEA